MTTITPTRAIGQTPPVTDAELERASWRIEREGIGPHRDLIDRMVARAARRPVSPVLIGVLADDEEPEVARIRAFGLLALQLASDAERQHAMAA